jgi:hypothetical protein
MDPSRPLVHPSQLALILVTVFLLAVGISLALDIL